MMCGVSPAAGETRAVPPAAASRGGLRGRRASLHRLKCWALGLWIYCQASEFEA